MNKSFNILKKLHCKSKHHGTKPMHPFLLRVFQRHQKHNLKHPSLVHLITTKQKKTNYFHSYIHRGRDEKTITCLKEMGLFWLLPPCLPLCRLVLGIYFDVMNICDCFGFGNPNKYGCIFFNVFNVWN
jgi:hypothetical protein